MQVLIEYQVQLFLYCIILGIIFGIYYDLIKAWRIVLKTKVIATLFFDAIFWTMTTSTLFLFLINFAIGEGRAYVIFAILIGILLYYFILSKFVLKLFIKINFCMKKILKKVLSFSEKIR